MSNSAALRCMTHGMPYLLDFLSSLMILAETYCIFPLWWLLSRFNPRPRKNRSWLYESNKPIRSKLTYRQSVCDHKGLPWKDYAWLIDICIFPGRLPYGYNSRVNGEKVTQHNGIIQYIRMFMYGCFTGVFLACWVPFFTANIINAICDKLAWTPPGPTVFMVTTWLGYGNSFMNPVIYTIFNEEFRKAFLQILRFQRRQIK